MTMNDYKICRTCQQEKPPSAFYKRNNGSLYTQCKDCQKAQMNKWYQEKGIDYTTPVNRSEALVVEQLTMRNIPAYCGKTLGAKLADVLAWGCVLIECKLSSLREDGLFSWSLTPLQREKGLRAHLIVLCADYGHVVTYHLFPADSPIFYDFHKERRSELTYTPNVQHRRLMKSALTPEVMLAAEDNWQLIEHYRLLVSANLQPETFTSDWRVK